ncbi:MAG: 30S ribosome-binding factor RbfA [Clostridia bacterium]|nr:30S ribosome-binding factor RbfA [Clostridia bacterium]
MVANRQDRVNDAVAAELAIILRTVKDPRVSRAFISVSGAEVSKDLSQAKIFYSVFGPDKDVEIGINSASGYIRSELAKRLNLRITPKLTFIREHGARKAMDIAKILKDFQDEQQNS